MSRIIFPCEYIKSLDMTKPESIVPLCVDLDGTLVQADTLHESLRLLARRQPWKLLVAPIWVLKGKAQFKLRVASAVTLPVEQLPYDDRVRQYILSASEAGQPVWLVSGCHQSIATRVADFVGGFDGVLASDAQTNLTGSSKRKALCQKFGESGYDYIGNSRADIPVWSGARKVLVANASPALLQQVQELYDVAHHFPLQKP